MIWSSQGLLKVVCICLFLSACYYFILYPTISMRSKILLTGTTDEKGQHQQQPKQQEQKQEQQQQQQQQLFTEKQATKSVENRLNISQLIEGNVTAEDPRLIKVVSTLINPPANRLLKLSRQLFRTKQAEVVLQIMKSKRGGFFIECGALDGERSSNTISLEVQYGWTGLLVEMDPSYFLQLTGKNRNSYSINACISPKNQPIQVTFVEHNGGGGKMQTADHPAGKLHSDQRIYKQSINCFPLYTMLLALNRTKVDYFSLDVEGFELDILRSIPWDKLDISVLSVEYIHGKEGENAYVAFMEKQGYTVHSKINYHNDALTYYVDDLIFVKKKV